MTQRWTNHPLFHLATFLAVASIVMYGDLATKDLALAVWADQPTSLIGDRVALHVVHNRVGAFGMSLGELTREVNVGATLAAVLLAMSVCTRLALFDSAAPAGLGMIAGAGLGNLGSMTSSEAGVPDFIALGMPQGGYLVLNVADIAAYVGLACCIRVAFTIVGALRTRAVS